MNSYFTNSIEYTSPEPYYKLVHQWELVTLQQKNKRTFLVRYGMQVDHDLTYGEASRKLGEALMHQCQCDSELRS